jgi:3-methyladenine DNA glycosylase/8-oxoguanine DNA glycosylase
MVGVAARPGGTVTAPTLEVEAEARADAAAAGRALAGAFVTAPEALAELAAADPVVAGIAARFPGVGPVLQPDLLCAVVRSISAQQITLRFAAVLRGRLARRYGHRHRVPTGAVDTREHPTPESATLPHRGTEPGAGSLPPAPTATAAPGDPPAEVWSLDPHRLAHAQVGDLRDLQFSTSKATAMIAVAQAVAAGELDLEVIDTSGPRLVTVAVSVSLVRGAVSLIVTESTTGGRFGAAWTGLVPESVKVCPAIGTNCQS